MASQRDAKLNERIATIRENNIRLENRHIEIELDKKAAFENGSLIHPAQIKVTISRSDTRSNRKVTYDNKPPREKQKAGFRPRGAGDCRAGGNIGYNLSKSLSRLHQDPTINSQPQLTGNRPRGGGGWGSGGRGGYFKGLSKNVDSDYIRHVEINHSAGRGKSPRHPQNQNTRNYNHGPRNGQQSQQQQGTLTPARSMPSLDHANLRPHPRPQVPSGFRPPRFRRNSTRTSGPAPKPRQATSDRQLVPPPPPPFPPPSPSQPAPAVWPLAPVPRDSEGHWVRGRVIRHRGDDIRRVAAVGTQSESFVAGPPDHDSPFVNAEEVEGDNDDDDDEDGYIDDNPLDDLDQFTLKIDMDGGFVVHDATICDPILAKPISSWIDDIASEGEENETELRIDNAVLPLSPPPPPPPPPPPQSQPSTASKKKVSVGGAGKEVADFDSSLVSSSSLTTSGVSTLSSLDCRLVGEDVQTNLIRRSFSADNVDKASSADQRCGAS